MQNAFMNRTTLLESVIESLPYGLIVASEEGILLLANNLGRTYLDLPEGEGFLLEEYLTVIPGLSDHLVFPLKEAFPGFDLLAIKAPNGYLTVRGRPVPRGLALSIIDVTRSKEAEQHMLDAILEATEAQRRRLSKEIHDGIGPLISTIKLNMDALQLELKGENTRARKMIDSMSELLQTMSNDIRSISHNLMPNVLVDFGLVAALENLCQRVNSSGKVQANFYHSDIREHIRRKVALGLYRITQELINNAVKYARAQTINVQLIRHPESIVLMVEDDGIGFTPNQHLNTPGMDKGIGLRNIQTRVRSLGGTFLLESQPGEGVLATIEVPLKNQET
ncbi:MAG: sensor histidine kinase [Phaeodactylibacter sp.]|nr:sensor histidine kinase [Phaeodactylibacter sp.]MCB9291210.1 sensor histidine kinase [Lewinellaceae bacterium]